MAVRRAVRNTHGHETPAWPTTTALTRGLGRGPSEMPSHDAIFVRMATGREFHNATVEDAHVG